MRTKVPPEHCWHNGVCCWCGATDTVIHGPHFPPISVNLVDVCQEAADLLAQIGDRVSLPTTSTVERRLREAITAATRQAE